MTAEEILHAAVALKSPEERAAYLTAACGPDSAVRARIDGLLKSLAEAGSFLEQPLFDATAAEPGCSEKVGTIIGPYKLLQQIGEGGMGVVYMAERSEPVRQIVALKIIKPGMDSRQVIARFEAERQALAMMDHPNIAKVFDAGTVGPVCRTGPDVSPADAAGPARQAGPTGRPYFVMELVKGVAITKYCDANQLTLRERLELFIPVCQAVMHAHQKGIIHRDLKPSNVLVARYDDKPVPKVIDFGVAKATGQKLTERTLFTQFGQLVGTLEYMSPEQATLNALDIDTRSDIYSLGVLLYELLTGSTPFEKKRLKETAFDEILRIIREEEPPTPSKRLSDSKETLASIAGQRKTEPVKLTKLVRGDLDWIVMTALEKDRNRRYETASAFAADVERYLNDEPVEACPPSAGYRLRKFVRRHRGAILVGAVATALFVILAGGIGWIILDRQTREVETTRQVQESMTAARFLLKENQPGLARQKVAEAKVLVANHRVALGDLALEVDAFDADLERFQRFFGLVDQARQTEFRNEGVQSIRPFLGRNKYRVNNNWQSARTVPFDLQALKCYEVLDREDWLVSLEHSALGKDQVEQVRRTVYEELAWLALDLIERRLDHASGERIDPESAARHALEYLRQAEIARAPTHGFYEIRAVCHEALGQPEAARADRELARRTPPTTAFDYYQRGQAAYTEWNKAEAIKAFEAGLSLEPTDFWSMMRLGLCLCDMAEGPEDFRAAVWVFRGCIVHRSNYANAHRYLALAYIKLEQWAEAIGELTKAIELQPQAAIVWSDRSVAYARLQQWDMAFADFSKAIALNKRIVLTWSNLWVLRRWPKSQRLFEKALDELTKAIATEPNYADYRNVLSYFLATHPDPKIRDPRRAVELAKKAVELAPTEGGYWNTLGIAHYRAGEWQAAFAALNKTMEDTSWNWFYLAMAHWQVGHKNEARQVYAKAVQWMDINQPTDPELAVYRAEAAELLGIKDEAKAHK